MPELVSASAAAQERSSSSKLVCRNDTDEMRPEKSPSFSNGSRLSVRDGRGADGIKF